jgi:SPP1 family predicted phage head-tail adaptor
MRAGAFRHRVTVQTQTRVSDGHDGYVPSWVTSRARIAAKVATLDGRDLDRARQIDPRAGFEVSLRYWADYRDEMPAKGMRIVYHDGDTDRTLEPVEPLREPEYRQTLAVICREAQ